MTHRTGGKIENWSKVNRENAVETLWEHDSLPIRVVAYSIMENVEDPYQVDAEVYHNPDDPVEGTVPTPQDRHRTEIRNGGTLNYSSMSEAKDSATTWMQNHPDGGTLNQEANDIKVNIEEGATIHHAGGTKEKVKKIRDTGVITLELLEDPYNKDGIHGIGDTYDIEMDDIREKRDQIEILHPR